MWLPEEKSASAYLEIGRCIGSLGDPWVAPTRPVGGEGQTCVSAPARIRNFLP